MVQAVWLDAGARAPGRLLLSIHHLSGRRGARGVSWVPDLAAAWAACARGETPKLPPRGTSFRRWAHWLAEQAVDVRRVEELAFWRAMLSAPSAPLVAGSLDPARDVVGTAGQIGADATGVRDRAVVDAGAGGVPLRHPRSAADRSGGGDRRVARAAWSEGKRRHSRRRGRPWQEEPPFGIDLSRTVGWFTSMSPVRLDMGTLDVEEALAGGEVLGRALKLIKEQNALGAPSRAKLWTVALSESGVRHRS